MRCATIPERVQFVGYDPHVVRYLAFCFSGFFAGIAGALAAINFEIANSAYLGAVQSGTVLFATYIGGIGFFIGPIVGAIFVTFLSLGLSDVTPVWQLYFGLIFIAVVVFAPGGITGLLMMHRPLLKAGTLTKVVPSYLVAFVPTLAMIAGLILAIEIIVHYSREPRRRFPYQGFRRPASMRPTGMSGRWRRSWLVGGYWVARKTWTFVGHAWDDATSVREKESPHEHRDRIARGREELRHHLGDPQRQPDGGRRASAMP